METPAAIAELLKENWRRRRVVALEGILGWKWRHLVIPPTPDECSSIRMMETVMVHQLGDKFTLSTALRPCKWVSEWGREGWMECVRPFIYLTHSVCCNEIFLWNISIPNTQFRPVRCLLISLHMITMVVVVADPGHPSIHSIAGQPEK